MKLGIDIGGTSIKSGILDAEYNLTARKSFPTNQEQGPEALQSLIKTIIEAYLSEYESIESIGIGVPGVVDTDGTVLIAPNLSGWVNIPFGDFLRSFIKVPFALDNDANAAAVAEMKLGAGLDYDDFIYVTLGTGVGGAIIYDKKLFRGSRGGAGEFGHITIDCINEYYGLPDYRQGTVEEFVGRNGILRHAADLLEELCDGESSELSEIENYDVREISELAEKGDALCFEVMANAASMLGVGLANVMNVLDISVAIFGGGISKSSNILYDVAFETLKLKTLPSLSKIVKILPAKFESETGVIGSALLPTMK